MHRCDDLVLNPKHPYKISHMVLSACKSLCWGPETSRSHKVISDSICSNLWTWGWMWNRVSSVELGTSQGNTSGNIWPPHIHLETRMCTHMNTYIQQTHVQFHTDQHTNTHDFYIDKLLLDLINLWSGFFLNFDKKTPYNYLSQE